MFDREVGSRVALKELASENKELEKEVANLTSEVRKTQKLVVQGQEARREAMRAAAERLCLELGWNWWAGWCWCVGAMFAFGLTVLYWWATGLTGRYLLMRMWYRDMDGILLACHAYFTFLPVVCLLQAAWRVWAYRKRAFFSRWYEPGDTTVDSRTDFQQAASEKAKHQHSLAVFEFRGLKPRLFTRVPKTIDLIVDVESLVQILGGRNGSLLQDWKTARLRIEEAARTLHSVNVPKDLNVTDDVAGNTAMLAMWIWEQRLARAALMGF